VLNPQNGKIYNAMMILGADNRTLAVRTSYRVFSRRLTSGIACRIAPSMNSIRRLSTSASLLQGVQTSEKLIAMLA
jgi:hypothetical protein